MKLKISYLILFTLIVNIFSANATIRFVSKTGTITPPYTSWETAADSIQKCINSCVDGDTIYVANGSYAEKVIVDKFVYLIGLSQDSCIIDGSNELSEEVVRFNSNGAIENFTIKARGQNQPTDCAITYFTNVYMKYCKLENGRNGLLLVQSSSIIENNIILNCYKAIDTICPTDTCNGFYNKNIIISVNSFSPQILHSLGGTQIMRGNILLSNGTSTFGGSFESQKKVVFENNLISGFQHRNISVTSHSDSIYIQNNNSLNVQIASGFYFLNGDKVVVKNNIVKNTNIGVSGADAVKSDYNLFDNVNLPVNGGAFLGTKNVFANPMFVNDTIPTANGSYDLQLQKYSPAVDSGDPNILDKDGTRSDIGMYGGTFGETYTYQDLAPLAPRNLSAVVDTNKILVKWNRNTEADTAYYNVYRDTVINFLADSTKLISSQTDTFFVHLPPYNSSKYVYKVTCLDNQDNESQPSNELVVNITSVSTNDYPMTISDYILYQNYPNPFNPSTKIGYQLKERAYVKLMVYDLKGELISVMVNKEQNAGYYEVEFSSSSIEHPESSIKGIASGIYLYRIELIGEGKIPIYTEMKKMILIK